MPTRKVLKSALHGFLGTYISRYSDYEGYWLFGFLVGQLGTIEIDLLARADVDAADADIGAAVPADSARKLAVARFSEQLGKAGLGKTMVRQAALRIERIPGAHSGPINGHPTSGFRLRFAVDATADTGQHFAREAVVFVAPHNPAIELRSGRFADAGGSGQSG